MEKSQFIFSFIVGLAFIIIGSVISTLASIGISLGLLGVAIIVVSILTRLMADENHQKPELLRVRVHKQDIKQPQR